MNEKLIKQAKKIPYHEHYKIKELIDKATDLSTIERLHTIEMYKYRQE